MGDEAGWGKWRAKATVTVNDIVSPLSKVPAAPVDQKCYQPEGRCAAHRSGRDLLWALVLDPQKRDMCDTSVKNQKRNMAQADLGR